MKNQILFWAVMLLTGFAFAQPAKIIKVFGDTTPQGAPMPFVNKEWPMVAKLLDEAGKPVREGSIQFRLVQGAGMLTSESKSAGSFTSTTVPVNFYGEAWVFLQTESSTGAVNGIEARATGTSLLTNFTVTTTSAPIAVSAQDAFQAISENEAKVESMVTDIEITSDADYMPPLAKGRATQKGEKHKFEQSFPVTRTLRPPTFSTAPATPADIPEHDLIGSSQDGTLLIVRERLPRDSRVPFRWMWVDMAKGMLARDESFLDAGAGIFRDVHEFLDPIRIPEAQGFWAFNRRRQRVYKGIFTLGFTTETRVLLRSQINSVPDSAFGP